MIFPYIFPLQLHNVPDEVLHTGGAILFHAVGDMAVLVQSKSGGSVSQTGLHSLDIVPGPDRVHGVGVAQAMEVETGQTGSSGGVSEHPLHFPLIQQTAVLYREHKARRIAPKRPRFQLHFQLPTPLAFQSGENGPGGMERPKLPAFGRLEQAHRPVFPAGELLSDSGCGASEGAGASGRLSALPMTMPATACRSPRAKTGGSS